jgi:hypothetical protein
MTTTDQRRGTVTVTGPLDSPNARIALGDTRFLPAEEEQLYSLVQDGNGGQPVECWPRTAEGAINAINHAARLSLRGEPITVYRPNRTPLARFVGGAREGRTRPLLAPRLVAD